ncbi:hypothetical protein Fmac_016714 [Flemingia macrophylla]|uniref:RRM domain-containing protein n=1 Tax=Flemingia macrophylla TaxID=520843 RepID=A0ABD1MI54_9FABA
MACSLKSDEEVSSPTKNQCELPPSKVVHFRNLPIECTDDDLIQSSKPFGRVTNAVCGVGLNKNQGFVEFEELDQAISMISHCASSSDHVVIRGRIVYVQYSDRAEISSNRFAKGNTLLVTMKLVQGAKLSIDVIHSVFSEYGFVQKISTFKKHAGFQILSLLLWLRIRFLADNAGNVDLCISYSEHQDLNIKFQSYRTRDYTNANLPVMHSIDRPTQLLPPLENHVLWASFRNLRYDVNVDLLYTVFSEIGTVEKISIFERHGQTQALIQYADVETAKIAKRTLDGICIYDGDCQLNLTYSRHSDVTIRGSIHKSRDFTKPWQNPQAASMYPGIFHPLQVEVYGGIPSWPIHGYITAYGTFPEQTYAVPQIPGYAAGQSNGMAHNENSIEPSPPGVPSSSHYMQVSFVGFYPPAPYFYYYGY